MKIEKASRILSISKTFTPLDGQNVVTIIDNSLAPVLARFPSLGTDAWVNAHLTELRATAAIRSLPEVAIPQIDTATDNETSRLVKTLDTKWKSPRLELSLWIAPKPTGANPIVWVWISDVSLQNPSGYPYTLIDVKRYFTNNLTFDIGENMLLGLSVKNITFNGAPYSLQETDKLTIRGSWRQEIFSLQPDNPVNLTEYNSNVQRVQQRYEDKPQPLTANTRLQLLPVRESRVNALIQVSATNSNVFIKEGTGVTQTDYTYILSGNASQLLTPDYNGVVTAITGGTGITLTTKETYNVAV